MIFGKKVVASSSIAYPMVGQIIFRLCAKSGVGIQRGRRASAAVHEKEAAEHAEDV